MSLKLKSRPMFTLFAFLSTALILVSGIFLNVATASPGPTISAACTNGTTAANQCTSIVLDNSAGFDVGFKPSVILVHHDEWITISDPSQIEHTFTLVAPSFEPHTVAQMIACGAPGTVCLAAQLAHDPSGAPPPPPPSPPYPNSCETQGTAPTILYQCVKSGTGLASGSPFPTLSTPFTSTTGGDSIVLFPGESFMVQITAPAGTVLHFMCIIHPWMQGVIVVTA
ncbi:MAG TPA: hypothetical protein VED17_03775 [Nitrososphaerales archaeon]|nr:hypothetical protein [Nitrososphaerales archaeon]